MSTSTEAIVELIKSGNLPSTTPESLLSLYDPARNIFPEQECAYWDYKAQFPFSLSDDYFGGILRLVCAFYNSFGGLIIFGVKDETRTPGHNAVKINIERLNNVIRTALTTPIELKHQEYLLGRDGGLATKVDVLLVPKRPMSVPPVRFSKKVGQEPANRIFMRVGHEVVEPTSIDLPALYSSRDDYGLASGDGPAPVQSALPPRPATLKEFIGRRDALDRLYSWLFASDEPRTFLYGKGGSGKSTIGFEFARLIGECGGNIPTKLNRTIDYVLFLSAKAIALEPMSRQAIKNQTHDFSNARELYEAILTLVGWTNSDSIFDKTDSELLSELQSLVDTAQLLIVIDDIDTLTTAGRDPGMDDLYRLVIRSKSGGKILYTLRNAPTQSLANAIEVPGLDPDGELPDFVNACAAQFRVAPPSADFLPQLSEVTERRPLAVEVLIGLRRTSGSYHEALKLYQGREGDELRKYLFQREYSALPSDNRARLFLAALALFGRPAAFPELQAVLQFSPEQLNDCISQTLEMFLQSEVNSSGHTIFSLGDATAQFISSVSPDISVYNKLKASVRYFKSPFLPKNAQMSQIQFEVSRFFARQDYERAVEVLTKPDYPAAISQHPILNTLKGRALAKLRPPKYEEARAAFSFAASHGTTDVQGFRDWYYMEKDSGFNDTRAIDVCNIVVAQKGIPNEAKAEFLTKKGIVYRNLATQSFHLDPEKSIVFQGEALAALHESYELYARATPDQERFSRTREALQEVFRYMFICAGRSLSASKPDLIDAIFRQLTNQARNKTHSFDLMEKPAVECVSILRKFRSLDERNQNRAFVQRLLNIVDGRSSIPFGDESVRRRVANACRDALKQLSG